MERRTFVLVAFWLTVSLAEDRRRFDRYHVYEVEVQGTEQASYIQQLAEDGLLEVSGSLHPEGGTAHLIVPPEQLGKVLNDLLRKGMVMEMLEDDLQRRVDKEWESISSRMDNDGRLVYDPNDFNDLDSNRDEVRRLAQVCRNGFRCMVRNLGQSAEGRPIQLFTISRMGTNNNPIIVIDSTIHGHEWLATTTAHKIIDALVNLDSFWLLSLMVRYDFHIIPIVNPDGYDYAWTTDRVWRKSRSVEGSCIGVDLNSNFATDTWGTEGVSTNPCSALYCGSSPGSEPETRAIQDHAMSFVDPVTGASRIRAWISLHTFGWNWMFPWGNTLDGACQIPDDFDNLLQVSDAAVAAVLNKTNEEDPDWQTGTSCELSASSSGSVVDWVKAKANVKYTFNPELRGPWFEVDRTNIEPAYNETWAGIEATIREIENIEGYG